MSQARLHARVHGRVQGVNFRNNTVMTARQLGITGWVQNMPDGTVEVMAEGERAQLDDLLDFLREGPSAARVENVDANWQEANGEFETFRVTRP